MNPWRYALRASGDANGIVLVDAKAIVCTDRFRMHAAPHCLGDGPWTETPLGLLLEEAKLCCKQKRMRGDGLLSMIDLDHCRDRARVFPPWKAIMTQQPRISLDATKLNDILDKALRYSDHWRRVAYTDALVKWSAQAQRSDDDRPQPGDFCATLLFTDHAVFGGWIAKPYKLELGPALIGWPTKTTGMYNVDYLYDATRDCVVIELEILGSTVTHDGNLLCPLRIVTSNCCMAVVQSIRM